MYTSKEVSTMRMTITASDNGTIERVADVHFKSEKGKGSKVLMKFTSPPKIKGTAFLSLKQDGDSNSDQWICFPAYHKARRLSSRKKSDSFLDSDFSNGDISFEYHEGFSFKVIKEQNLDQVPVYVLEGTTTSKESPYSRQIMYIDKKTNLNLKTEFYNQSGKLFKELAVKKWTKYKNHWAIDEGVMKNLETNSSTKIEFIKRNIQADPADKIFTLVHLEKGQ